MAKIFITALLMISSISHADVIKCSFTEPFVGTVYSMTQSTLTYSDFEYKKHVIKNVSFQIKEAGVFELVAKDGKVLQTLTLNHKGSDGMSDYVYPYDVKDSSMLTYANNGYGGCSSNHLKVINPEEVPSKK